MIKFCAQVEIQRSSEQVWDWMMKDFPPEQRHVGTIDMAALAAEAEAKKASEGAPAAANRVPATLSEMEILDWQEGHSFVIRFSDKPYLKGLVADVWLKELGLEKTLANVRLELTLGYFLTFPVGIIYRLLRGRVDAVLLQSLAGMRYEIETGKKRAADQKAPLPLDGTQKVQCQ
ncbi:MAG: hypothetical protein ABI690_15520 [Chloroflexota bacterium]